MNEKVTWYNENPDLSFKIESYILTGVILYDEILCEYLPYIYAVPKNLFKDINDFKNWINTYNYITLYDEIELALSFTFLGETIKLYDKNIIVKIYWNQVNNTDSEFNIGKFTYAYGKFQDNKFKINYLDDYSKDTYGLYINLLKELNKHIKNKN